jgi:uncharacterized protein Usg
MTNNVSPEFLKRLQGCVLTFVEIEYCMPDHPSLLQLFLWQTQDQVPELPRVKRLLGFWRRELAYAPIQRVRVAHSHLVRPMELKLIGTELQIH